MQILYYKNRSICIFFIFQKRLTFSHNISCCSNGLSYAQINFQKLKLLIETIVALFSKMQIFVHTSDDF